MKHGIGQEVGDDLASALDDDSPIVFGQRIVDEAKGGPIQIPMVSIPVVLNLNLNGSDIQFSFAYSWVANIVL